MCSDSFKQRKFHLQFRWSMYKYINTTITTHFKIKTTKQVQNKMRNLVLLIVFALMQTGTHAVDYQVNNNVPSTPGGMVFTSQIGSDYSHQALDAATNFIWSLFQETDPASRKDVQQVTLVIESFTDAVAKTGDNIIHFSSDYLASYSGDVKSEFTGVIYHEMTHVWQWNGNGNANGGLIEGIADFVRLKAGLGPSNWVQPGQGDRWDQGYSVTARFLDYCESLMNGFVAQLNGKMRDGYSDGFFSDLLGKPVDQLWSEYKAKYGN